MPGSCELVRAFVDLPKGDGFVSMRPHYMRVQGDVDAVVSLGNRLSQDRKDSCNEVLVLVGQILFVRSW